MRRSLTYRLLVRTPLWIILGSIVLVIVLRWVPVRYTPLMLKRAFQFRAEEDYRTEQEWVSREHISPELVEAVIACEDQLYRQHHGFDWEGMRIMWQRHREEDAVLRGCSTISQQTAKNVFTFGSKTLLRKAVEAYWTCLIEIFWGKDRILEVYLNVVETGRGIYGVEAASLHYYGCHAADMDLRQGLSLAVCLPSPLSSDPLTPGPYARARRNKLIGQLYRPAGRHQ